MSDKKKISIILSSVFLYPIGIYWFIRLRESVNTEEVELSRVVLFLSLVITAIYMVSFIIFTNILNMYSTNVIDHYKIITEL